VSARASDIDAPVEAAAIRREPRFSWLWQLLGNPLGRLGLVLVLIIIVSAIGADALAPYDYKALDIKARLEPPSWAHPMGTDNLGRDTFSRILFGGRIALWVALVGVGGSLILGLVLGMLAGYGPRWFDNLVLMFFDAVRSFPVIMFALAIITVVGPSLETIIFVVVVTSVPGYGRIVRSSTLSIRNTEFILAEQSLGAGMVRVLGQHVLPNVVAPLLILGSMDIPVVITLEAGLSFLGLGVKPPTPSWGSILNDGFSFIRNTPWLVIAGGIPLIITTLGFTFLGESLRDVFDPKLKKDR
jgi:peptide/nickel transport system permease protein